MRDYVLPCLARKRVDAVTTADVMAVLPPVWSTRRVTAGRVRQRIGAYPGAMLAFEFLVLTAARSMASFATSVHAGTTTPAGPNAYKHRASVPLRTPPPRRILLPRIAAPRRRPPPLGTGAGPWYRHPPLSPFRHRTAGARDRPMQRPVAPPAAIDYPTSDGKRLAENDPQLHAIHYAFGALRMRYDGRREVYVSADLLVYYEEGNPRVSVAPDVFVVFGVEDRMRGNYKVWEEGKGPDFVLETASPNTWREDVERKPGVYAGLGVREYFLFDPTGEHLTPRLRGYRLVGGAYEPLSAVESIDRTLMTISSEVLGLELRAKGGEMRFHDPETGETLLSHNEERGVRLAAEVRADAAEARAEEEAAARRGAEARAEEEAVARRAADARIAELEARLAGESR